MRSTFFGLETGRSALMANQISLDVVGHNIANAATPGYSRQAAIMAPNRPFMTPGLNSPTTAGQIGTGVYIEQIRRYRDLFIDLQYRKENKALGEWEAKQKSLEQMELIYNEPSDRATRNNLDAYWQALQDLSVKPEDEAVRTTVRQNAITLCTGLNQTYKQLEELRKDNDSEIVTVVNEINSLARQIRDLNQEIIRVEVTGNNANDYRDRRDLLLDGLSKKIGIQYEEDSQGAVHVFIMGKELVSATDCKQFNIQIDSNTDPKMDLRKVVWSDTGDSVSITGGTLKGILDVRDQIIPRFMSELNNVAATLAAKINEVHRGGLGLDGQTNIDFFVSNDGQPINAKNITVSKDVMNSLRVIAAAPKPDGWVTGTPPAPGEGKNALAMANTKHTKYTIGTSFTTIGDYFNSSVSTLGVMALEAESTVANKETLLDGLEVRRQSVAGVSQDDEMVSMIKFQHGYSAASRIITVMDEMLDTIINRMGA